MKIYEVLKKENEDAKYRVIGEEDVWTVESPVNGKLDLYNDEGKSIMEKYFLSTVLFELEFEEVL